MWFILQFTYLKFVEEKGVGTAKPKQELCLSVLYLLDWAFQKKGEMEAVAIFGSGAPPRLRPPTRTFCSLARSRTAVLRRRDHLSAFPSNSNLFFKLSTRYRAASSDNESFIFLPHLVASLVCSLFFHFFCSIPLAFLIDLF